MEEKPKAIDLAYCDFHGTDLCGINPDGMDFYNGYFRQADLPGINFSKAVLQELNVHALG